MSRKNLQYYRSAVALALVIAGSVPALAWAEDEQGMRVPENLSVSPAVKAARLSGDFSATITPRIGYKGEVHIGKRPDVKLKRSATGLALSGYFYPDDLGYYGGPVVYSAGQVNTYWGESDGSTWGNPSTFLSGMNTNAMIKMLDYYTGDTYNTSGHYPALGIYWYGGGPGSLTYDSNIASLVQNEATYDRANRGQSLNYNNIYHVFLPPGTDVCFDNPADGCYNPDGRAPGPFAFCGYHSYTQLGDGTVVLYTVEPYESVSGCSEGYGTPSDTANVLGHELAETITDPIPGTGWVGEYPDNSGTEIGDICAWVLYGRTIGKSTYVIQNWYSDKYHACAAAQ